jgi:hypothetical protein
VLREAAGDLCWLLSRGYAGESALKLVGDRYRLTARQRTAVARSSCSDALAARRRLHEVAAQEMAGRPLWLDGYNVLTSVEAALAGGVILAARDGAYRDMASMHGSYRRVAETRPALDLVARAVEALGVSQCVWYLDRPVSNSGRLKKLIEETAGMLGTAWRVELAPNPDAILSQTDEVVASADSYILDHCRAWFNLARWIITHQIPGADVIDLTGL